MCLYKWSPIYTTSGAAVGLPTIGEAVAPFFGLNGISHGSFLGPTWSLSVELLFYIITPFIFALSRRVLLPIIFASAAVYWLNEQLGIGGFPGTLYGLAAASLFWAWALGFYFYRFPSIFSAFCIIIVGSALLTKFNYEGGVWARQTFALTVIVVGLASLSPWRVRLPERLMTYLGDLSYPLFLIHMPVIIVGNGVFGVQSPAALVVLALALSAFCLHCVERPIQELLGNIGSHREGATR